MTLAAEAVPRSDRSRLSSLFAMYALHGLNLALPLITLPVVTRLLGPPEYGRYGVLLTWSGMALILIEFGMGIAATKAISGQPDKAAREALGRIVVYQTLNALLVLPPLGIVTFLWLEPAPELGPILLMLASGWSLALNTLWFRIARASVPRLMPVTVTAKLLSLSLVVGLLPLYPTLTVALLANLASGFWPVLDAWSVRHEIAQAVRGFSFAAWRRALMESAPVPLQRLGSGLYLLLPATLAASFFGLKVAGWYVLSDRIIRAGIGLFQPLTSTLFPLQLEVRGLPHDAPARKKLRRYLLLILGASLFASLFTCLVADFAARLVGGDAFAPAALFLRWMSPQVALVALNMVLTNQLYVLDLERVIARAVWVLGVAFAAIILLFGKSSPAFFAACCMLVEGALGLWLLIAWRSHVASAKVA
ncbi:MAG: polysaccharide biosynthesis protein [Myxococcaceae bacterium]|nr:polysaccharide biosynthesis protein [Myxococcaceae bacterium]